MVGIICQVAAKTWCGHWTRPHVQMPTGMPGLAMRIFPPQRRYHLSVMSTDCIGYRIEIVCLLRHVSEMYPAGNVDISRHLAISGFPQSDHTIGKLSANAGLLSSET